MATLDTLAQQTLEGSCHIGAITVVKGPGGEERIVPPFSEKGKRAWEGAR